MANMNDFEGAVQLYQQWKGRKSFGIHLNLSEGCPLRESQLLMDKGYYSTENGVMSFNLQTVKNRYLPKGVRKELSKELELQIIKVMDSGIVPSHIDGHHHIHTSPFIIPMVMSLAKKYHINRIRRMGYVPTNHGISKVIRIGWKRYAQLFHTKVLTADYFCGYGYYVDFPFHRKGKICELMIHPGDIHPEDEILLNQSFPFKQEELLTYMDL